MRLVTSKLFEFGDDADKLWNYASDECESAIAGHCLELVLNEAAVDTNDRTECFIAEDENL